MINVNRYFENAKIYVISLGAEYFCVYARNEDEAVELLVEFLSAEWYFPDVEVELMATSVGKTFNQYIADADFWHCHKHKVCVPKLKIQEVTI